MHGGELPTFEEHSSAVTVTFCAPVGPTPQATLQVAPQVTLQVLAILEAAKTASSRSELQKAAGLKDCEHFRLAYLEPLLAAGWLAMTIPNRPRSSKQRYRTTEAGRRVLQQEESK